MRINAKLFAIAVALFFAIADVMLAFTVKGAGFEAVGVFQILSAIGLQAAMVVLTWVWLRHRQPGPADLREPASYRAIVPITPAGVLLLAAALSLSLLYVGLVCPSEGLPVVRGRGFCN